MKPRALLGPALAAVLIAGACAGDDSSAPTVDTSPPSTQITAVDTTATAAADATTVPTTTERPHPPAPDGRVYPAVAPDADAAAARLYEVERLIHTVEPTDAAWPDLAHEQQMLYRIIGRNPDWIADVVAGAPDDLGAVIGRHLAARRAIADIGSGDDEPPVNVPAWEIIDPLPAAELRSLYEQAAADTGIDWAFLAAINLVETGFGRIHGLSTAGAQGPMQFLPTTFAEVSDGDIDDPVDAIPAAARYLVNRGGPDDMHRALFGYNNSDAYVAAITHYATLFRADERSFLATHSWEIHYSAAAGDLWFPVGFRRTEPQPVDAYLATAPWSAPPPPS